MSEPSMEIIATRIHKNVSSPFVWKWFHAITMGWVGYEFSKEQQRNLFLFFQMFANLPLFCPSCLSHLRIQWQAPQYTNLWHATKDSTSLAQFLIDTHSQSKPLPESPPEFDYVRHQYTSDPKIAQSNMWYALWILLWDFKELYPKLDSQTSEYPYVQFRAWWELIPSTFPPSWDLLRTEWVELTYELECSRIQSIDPTTGAQKELLPTPDYYTNFLLKLGEKKFHFPDGLSAGDWRDLIKLQSANEWQDQYQTQNWFRRLLWGVVVGVLICAFLYGYMRRKHLLRYLNKFLS